jgi:hypothetical protein
MLLPYEDRPLVGKAEWAIFLIAANLSYLQEIIWHELENETDGGIEFENDLLELYIDAAEVLDYLLVHYDEIDPSFREKFSKDHLETIIVDCAAARYEINSHGLSQKQLQEDGFLEILPEATYWIRRFVLSERFSLFRKRFERAMEVVYHRLNKPPD